MRYLKKIISLFTIALLLITSVSAQQAIQADIKSLLNVRIVTTLTNNKLVLWKDALDGGESGMATMSAAKSLADPNPRALPDDGIFHADDTRPFVVLNYTNADSLGFQARRSLSTDTFSIVIPERNCEKVFLWCMSGNGSSTLDFQLIYSDKTTEECQRVLPDWYNEILPNDKNLCYLAKNMGKWDKTNKLMEADHHYIHGIILHPNTERKLQKIVVMKKATAGVLTLWGVTMQSEAAKLAQTPPMGWMTWYTFIDKIDEKLIMEVADSMVSTGLRDAGYRTLHLDDGWMADKRDSLGRQYANKERFPHGMKYLADYAHKRGLKLGIYSSAGVKTCAGYPGSYNHEEIDAQTYADWGIDFLKFDACGDMGNSSVKELNYKMTNALKKTGRSILFEICIFGSDQTHLWGGEIANMWRTGGDIVTFIDKNPEVTYKNWLENLSQVIGKEASAGPGHWNDPDNLIVGYPRFNKQTFEEQKAQFSFWALVAAPMITCADVRNMTPEIKSILLNKEVIAISQDKAGKQGRRIISEETQEIWMKNLGDGSIAIILFNKKETTSELTFKLSDINQKGNYVVHDLWQHADKGLINGSYRVKVAPHGVALIKLIKK